MGKTELDQKQKAFVLYAAKVLNATNASDLDSKIQSLSQDELKTLTTSFDDIYNQQMENNTLMAKLGAKLNFIKKLNGECPEGYEVEKFSAGGKTCMRCKKMQDGAIPVTAHKKGAKVINDIKADIAKEKCGGKAKKKKMECGGKTEKAACGSKMKMQKGGDMKDPKKRPSQDHAWDPDGKQWVYRPAGDGKPQNKVLESSKKKAPKSKPLLKKKNGK